MRIYKFVKWSVLDIKDIDAGIVEELHLKARTGKKLNRQEKDILFEKLQTNSYSKTGIPVLGWMFDFFEILNQYYVETKHYGVLKVYAPDKTSIRKYYKQVYNITQFLN